MTIEYNSLDREYWVRKAKAAALLDAAFLVHYYNRVAKIKSLQRSSADIELLEIFPDLSKAECREAEKKAEKLLCHYIDLGASWFKDSQATRAYEDEFRYFVNENPGFSDECYKLVADHGIFVMR